MKKCCTGNCNQGHDCEMRPPYPLAERWVSYILTALCILALVVIFWPQDARASQVSCTSRSGSFVAEVALHDSALEITIGARSYVLSKVPNPHGENYAMDGAHVTFLPGSFFGLALMIIQIGQLAPPGSDFVTMLQYAVKQEAFWCSRPA